MLPLRRLRAAATTTAAPEKPFDCPLLGDDHKRRNVVSGTDNNGTRGDEVAYCNEFRSMFNIAHSAASQTCSVAAEMED